MRGGTEPFIHPTAVVEDGAEVGPGARIWHFVHVRAGAHVGARTSLGKSAYVDRDVSIGNDCRIQNSVSVYAGATLEDEVFVGPSAVFTNDRYPRASNAGWQVVTTRVSRGASIGANATILCGVTIGAYAMVGAGAVVTSDVEPHRLVVGVPARPIGWVCRCGHPVAGGPGSSCGVCGELLEPP